MGKIKTIDVNAKEWFDKVNGNSYFSGIVTINYGMEDLREYIMPFQYGYGSQYEFTALKLVRDNEPETAKLSTSGSLRLFCEDCNIILRRSLKENCLKGELTQ